MPEILLAKTAGYCFGVRRAVDTALELAEKHRGKCRIYTLGPLIHNQHVIDELESKGGGTASWLSALTVYPDM